MAYVTLQDLTDRYGAAMLIDLTDRASPATGTVDNDTVDRAIADTAAVIDGYLARRYRLPLAETPALVGDVAAAIAIWKLHVYEPAGKIEADYKEAMRQLGDISAGRIALPLDDGSEAEGTGGTGAQMTDRERPFTEGGLKGFI